MMEEKENMFASPSLPALTHTHKTKKIVPKTPEECIAILESSPMVELTRRKPKASPENGPIPLDLDEDSAGTGIKKTDKVQLPDKSDSLVPEDEHDGAYFRDMLKTETARLSEIRQQWGLTLSSDAEHISSEVHGEICSVIGVAQLLMDQRFHQFSELIDDCEFKRGEKETLNSDLQGFWDMIHYQVEDVDKKFAALDKLKTDNWVRASPPKKVIKKKKLPFNKKPTISTKSNFSAFRAKLKQDKPQDKLFDGVFFQIKSPSKERDTSDKSGMNEVSEDQPHSGTKTIIGHSNAQTNHSNTAGNGETNAKSTVPFRDAPIAIVTPKRRYMPVVPSPLLHDITPKDVRTRLSRSRVSLSIPFCDMSMTDRRRSTRSTPLHTVSEVSEGAQSATVAAGGSTPVTAATPKSYTPVPEHGDDDVTSTDVEKVVTVSRKRSSSGDLVVTSAAKRRRASENLETREKCVESRMTRGSLREKRRHRSRGSGRIPARRSARLCTASGLMKVSPIKQD